MIGYDKDQKHFNSHPHEEDDMAFSRLFLTSFSFQLTSSRRGWQSSPDPSLWLCSISTHILTKRMTEVVFFFPCFTVFQLTSSRRGWPPSFRLLSHLRYFNSHPHEEDDDSSCVHRDSCRIISTHILTKRMTKAVMARSADNSFQLTSSRRGWQQF